MTPDVTFPGILSLREQAALRQAWLHERLDTILPDLMARSQIDCWLVIAREYNEDPVMMTLIPPPALSARRRTILAFFRRPGGTVERLTLDRYGHGNFYMKAWDPDEEPDQYACLARLLQTRKPEKIALNFSETFAFADGLTYQEHARLVDALGPEMMARVVSGEGLTIGWLERRLPAEQALYPRLVGMAHRLIALAFSPAVVTPGETTCEDVVWWLRQQMSNNGLRAWFQPTLEIQAAGQPHDDPDPRTLIRPGDFLHVDVGFEYLGLCTDHQQHAYVLLPGEASPPQGLVKAFKQGQRAQELHLQEMVPGRTGNEVLAAVLASAENAGLAAQVYSHPIGYHGHAAGPTIGLWDQQDGVPGKGDYPLFDDTCYSIELNVRAPVPEWAGQHVRIALEEDALLREGRCAWLFGRQEKLHVIPGGLEG